MAFLSAVTLMFCLRLASSPPSPMFDSHRSATAGEEES